MLLTALLLLGSEENGKQSGRLCDSVTNNSATWKRDGQWYENQNNRLFVTSGLTAAESPRSLKEVSYL